MNKAKNGSELLRKTFTSEITVSHETASALINTSHHCIGLWNLARLTCFNWLRASKEAKAEIKQLVEQLRQQSGQEEIEVIQEIIPSLPSITPFSLNYWLVEARKEKSEFLFLDKTTAQVTALPTDLAREVLKKLAGSFQSWFELRAKKDVKAKPPSVKGKDFFLTLSWSSPKIIKSGKETFLRIPVSDKMRIELPIGPYLSKMIEGKVIKHVTLSKPDPFGPLNRFKLSIVCGSPLPALIESPATIRAIDLGAGSIAISDSSGHEFLLSTRRPDKFWRPKIKSVEDRLKACTKGSRAYNRRLKARRIMHQKAGAQHKDHQRKVALQLVDDCLKGIRDMIVIGKMNTRLGLARSRGTADQHWGVQNTGYHQRFVTFLKEKAAERGIHVLELPDPPRKGSMVDPEVKFIASRSLLLAACRPRGIEMPEKFTRLHFKTNQGGKKEVKLKV